MRNIRVVGAVLIFLTCSSAAVAQGPGSQRLLKSPEELKWLLEPDIRDVPLHPLPMPRVGLPPNVAPQSKVGAASPAQPYLRGDELARTLTCHWLVPAPDEVGAPDLNSQEFFLRDGTWRIDGGRYGERYGTFVVTNDEFCVSQDGQPLRCRKLTHQGERQFTTIESGAGRVYTTAVLITKEPTASSC